MTETPIVTEEEIRDTWKQIMGEPAYPLWPNALAFAQAIASLAAKRAVEKWGHVLGGCCCHNRACVFETDGFCYKSVMPHARGLRGDPRCALADRKPE